MFRSERDENETLKSERKENEYKGQSISRCPFGVTV